MQDTSANPYAVRLHSARLANAYMDDLRLTGSRRNAQEDRGEERTYKVTVNTAVDPFSALLAGTVGTWFAAHHADRVTGYVIHDLKVVKDLKEEAEKQRAKSQEHLKQQEQKLGKTTSDMLKQNHQGGHLEGFGAALGKFVVDALSNKTEEVRQALEKKPRTYTPAEIEQNEKDLKAYEINRLKKEKNEERQSLKRQRELEAAQKKIQQGTSAAHILSLGPLNNLLWYVPS